MSEIETIKINEVEYAERCLELINTIKYMVGIAERGEQRKIEPHESPDLFVLGYVKTIEEKNIKFADALERIRNQSNDPMIIRYAQEGLTGA